jgi:two-component system, sensor histidine kinase and response regulator
MDDTGMTAHSGPTLRPLTGVFSLRTKLVLFISLIIIAACSCLSWYFIHQQADTMTRSLIETGTILVKNLAHNSRYAAITEDRVDLEQYLAGVMDGDAVVYAVITGANGVVLAGATKGRLTDRTGVERSSQEPLYPDPKLAQALFDSAARDPVITLFGEDAGGRPETLYDFAMPILRRPSTEAAAGPLPFPLEQLEGRPSKKGESDSGPAVLSVVQIGLTRTTMQQALSRVARNVVLITTLIILVGIATTIILADRTITPLKHLASVAKRVAEGDLVASVVPSTRDEVGELAGLFNRMTQSLKERDLAIRTQLNQLHTLNRMGTAIVSTLDIDKLLNVVLDLLMDNLGYQRMLIMLYDPHRQVAYGARMSGVSPDVERAGRLLEVPIQDDDSIHADLLLRGRGLVVTDMEAVAGRIFPSLLALARQEHVSCFVAAPLKSSQRIMGFIAADRSEVACRQEDLDLLLTIATQIAVAIDNAQAYQDLEELTQTLERRVQDRTCELVAANEKLQELDRLKSAFVSIVSHELRTPMTSIKGYIENMLDGLTGTLSDRQAYYLGRVKYNVERLTRMINDLLDLSRIEAGRVELTTVPLAISELVPEIVESLQPVGQAKSISIQHGHEGGPVKISGDRDKLHQILTNLIQNAVKFTPARGQIRVETRVVGGGVVQFCVSDTGCGIAPHEQGKIFERFYRGEGIHVEQRGAGLGLAITKSLVEMHGGKIWVESMPGRGSRFYFTVPIAPLPL